MGGVQWPLHWRLAWMGGRAWPLSRESREPAGSVFFCFGFQSEKWILVSVGQVKKENMRPFRHKRSQRDGSSRKIEVKESCSKSEVPGGDQ